MVGNNGLHGGENGERISKEDFSLLIKAVQSRLTSET